MTDDGTELDNQSISRDDLARELMERSLSEWVELRIFVDTDSVSRLLIQEFRKQFKAEGRSQTLDETFRALLERYDDSRKTLRDVLPNRFVTSLKQLVRRDYYADRQLVSAFVDHPAMRTVIDRVLRHTLTEFTERITDWIQDTGSIPGLQGTIQFFFTLFGRARNYTKRFSEELESRIQSRIDTYVKNIIDEVVGQIIDQLSSEELSGEFSQWREDLVDVVLDQPVNRYTRELQKLAPEQTARDLSELMRTLSEWDEFDQLVNQLVEIALDAFGEQSVGDLVESFRGGEQLREHLEKKLALILEEILEQEDK